MANDNATMTMPTDAKLRESLIVKIVLIVIGMGALVWISVNLLAVGNRPPAEIASAKSHSLIWIDLNQHEYHVAADPWFGRSNGDLGMFAPEWLAKATFCRIAPPPPGGFRNSHGMRP